MRGPTNAKARDITLLESHNSIFEWEPLKPVDCISILQCQSYTYLLDCLNLYIKLNEGEINVCSVLVTKKKY